MLGENPATVLKVVWVERDWRREEVEGEHAGEGVAGEDTIKLGHMWRRPGKENFPFPFNAGEHQWRD